MKEIEVKILNVNRSKIIESLSRLRAEKIFDGRIETLFFDFEDGRIAKAKNVMRLRKEEEKAVLTFKRILGNEAAKVAEEYEVEISNMENMKKILESLGLSICESMQKHRVSYKVEDLRFDLDKYEGEYDYIPELLEIEAKGIEVIHKYARYLGFSINDCLPWSTQEVVDYYSKQRPNKETY
jgi:adenylate cyclase class 2